MARSSDRFSCVTKLGEGQFGDVYKAKDSSIDDDFVAIKMIRVTQSNATSIKREMSLLKNCKSRYVIKLLNHYKSNGFHCMVLEYCSGGSIENRVGKCNEGECKKIAFDVLQGLLYLHANNIIHRDIKPSNILHSSEGIYKLADFGTCKDMKNSFRFTFPAGTLYYTAPEIISPPNGSSTYNTTVDIWSLGVTLYHLITNEFPFNFANVHAEYTIMDRIVRTQPKKLYAENLNGFSATICDIVNHKCLIRQSQYRSSASSLLEHKWFINDEKEIEQATVISYCESIKSMVENKYPAAYSVWQKEPEGTVAFLQAKGIIETQHLLKEFDMPFKEGTNNIDAWIEYKQAIYTYLTAINNDDRLKQAREIVSNEIWVSHYKRFPCWPQPKCINKDVIALNKKDQYVYQNKWFIVWSIGGSITITDHRPSQSIYKARFNGKPTLRVLKVDNKKFNAFNNLCITNKTEAIKRVKQCYNVAITWGSF